MTMPLPRSYHGHSLVLVLLALSGTSLQVYLVDPKKPPQQAIVSVEYKNEKPPAQDNNENTPLTQRRNYNYPRTVFSPSVSFATSPETYPVLKVSHQHDSLPLYNETELYKNYTDNYILTTNGVPLFNETCVPIKEWQSAYYPNCNAFHSIDYTDMMLLGVGNERIVWKLAQQNAALKMTRKNHFETQIDKYERFRIDAMISERLTASPHVLDIYGHCGLATLNQEGERKHNWVYQLRRANSKRKLSLVLQLARAVKDVHSIDGDKKVTAVWHNIKPDNVLFVKDKLVITDFDESILPRWDPNENKPCKFHLKNQKLKLYQPLELYFAGTDLDETIDVYSLGAMMHTMLTGIKPYITEDSALPVFTTSGIRRDEISRGIQAIAKECMALNPKRRPTAQKVVQNLEKLVPEQRL